MTGYKGQRLRCAIYTRKSTEEGLDQDFNSLDAQREACTAFIESQCNEGWILLPTRYDDGGFSGGNLVRPGLQRLLADIEIGKIDVVVLYKVDRLTRALSDFARIVEIFDTHAVSFVSITQQFNTTTSMGRLTLNVLLSFAQFEREVTGERIRDKILASRRKGMWMGGHPPLGYDVKDRKLVINKSEAKLVRWIFARYTETGCVMAITAELRDAGACSKRRISNAGRVSGGKPFSRGAIYKILGNKVYQGKAVHKGVAYPGEHAPIIEQDLWHTVQQRLSDNRAQQRTKTKAKSPSILCGLLFDEHGRRFTSSHATKGNRRYRYYVTPQGDTGKAEDTAKPIRFPACEIERLVMDEILGLMRSPTRLTQVLDNQTFFRDIDLGQVSGAAVGQAQALRDSTPTRIFATLRFVLKRITVASSHVEIEICPKRLLRFLLENLDTKTMLSTEPEGVGKKLTHTFRVPARLKRCGREMKIVNMNDGDHAPASRPNPGLIKAVARAHVWSAQLLDGEASSISEIAIRNGISRPYASRIISLAFLAPDIVTDILDGRQPPETSVETLTKDLSLPLHWNKQRQSLGFKNV